MGRRRNYYQLWAIVSRSGTGLLVQSLTFVKSILPLITAASTTLQGAVKNSLRQGVVQGHMTKEVNGSWCPTRVAILTILVSC